MNTSKPNEPPWWAPKDMQFSHGKHRKPRRGGGGKEALHDTIQLMAGQREEALQAAAHFRLRSIMKEAEEVGLRFVDTHTKGVLGCPGVDKKFWKMPDFCVVDSRYPVVAADVEQFLVVIVLDIKQGQDSWNGKDVGKLLDDLYYVLKAQHARPYAVGMLMGGTHAQCFKLQRDSTATSTRRFNLGRKEDAQLVAGFFLDRDASSYPLSPRVPEAGRLVGTGGTAAVFTHRRQPDTVIKISYRNVPGGPERVGVGDERRVLNRLAVVRAGVRVRVAPSDDGSNNDVLHLMPKFRQLTQPRALAGMYRSLLTSLIAPDGDLRLVHKAGFVHGDVRPPNIMVTADNRAALVDFSGAGEIGAPWRHGSLRYASDRVLTHFNIVNPDEQLTLLPADDVAALIRCILAVDYPPPQTANAAELLQHWVDVRSSRDRWAADLLNLTSGGEAPATASADGGDDDAAAAAAGGGGEFAAAVGGGGAAAAPAAAAGVEATDIHYEAIYDKLRERFEAIPEAENLALAGVALEVVSEEEGQDVDDDDQ